VRSTLTRLAAVVVIVLAGASCTKPLDTSGLETTLKQQLEAELGTTGLRVTCPDDVNVQKGGRFDCTVTKSGAASLTVEVTQKDDKGHVDWKVVEAATSTPATVTPSM
jgi:Domain of unknown function (DUF4333)